VHLQPAVHAKFGYIAVRGPQVEEHKQKSQPHRERGLRDTLIKAQHADSPWGVRRGCFHDHADCRP
jgi:hypothetical protein